MKSVLYKKALKESEDGLPEALKMLPDDVRKSHVETIINRYWHKVVWANKNGVTDLALLAKSFTLCYISESTAEEMVIDILS